MLFFFILLLWLTGIGLAFGGEGIACIGFVALWFIIKSTYGDEVAVMCFGGAFALFIATYAAGEFAHWFFHKRHLPPRLLRGGSTNTPRSSSNTRHRSLRSPPH